MIAAVLHSPGPPHEFRIEAVAEPELAANEVLVNVRACGVSYHDVLVRNGTYRRGVAFPIILGIEIAGEVIAVGDRVPDLVAADRVCSKAFASCGRCRLCRNSREATCSARVAIHGGYAERVAVPWDALVRIPEEVPFEVACSLGPTAGVALNAVRDVARVQIGESVLVTGATGGVGWFAIQLAKLAGAHVIAATRSRHKAEVLAEMGVEDVVVTADSSPVVGEVRRLTEGRGVDVVIDTVGSRVFEDSFGSLAVHGRYAFVGQLFGEDISINPARIFFKRAQLLGVGSVSRSQLEDVVELTAKNRLSPRIARRFALSEIAEAHRSVEEGSLVGRVVVIP